MGPLHLATHLATHITADEQAAALEYVRSFCYATYDMRDGNTLALLLRKRSDGSFIQLVHSKRAQGFGETRSLKGPRVFCPDFGLLFGRKVVYNAKLLTYLFRCLALDGVGHDLAREV